MKGKSIGHLISLQNVPRGTADVTGSFDYINVNGRPYNLEGEESCLAIHYPVACKYGGLDSVSSWVIPPDVLWRVRSYLSVELGAFAHQVIDDRRLAKYI